jgi:guanylate kinase
MRGRLIIISSPSGGGKGTLIKEVRGMMPELAYSVSFTTRQQRFGEEDGREYHFVTRERFEQLIASGEFLEYAEVHGNLYGTSISESEKLFNAGKDVIVEVDVQGAVQIMDKKNVDSIGIFILPPSFEVLKARLTARATEGEAELRTRLVNAFGEIHSVFDEAQQYSKFKYVVVNEDVPVATRQIASIIIAERQLANRQADVIRGILDSFDDARRQFAT